MLSKKQRKGIRNTSNFKSTNTIWNELKLNQTWSIGYLIDLCKKSKAVTFEEWEKYYLNSGNKRDSLISTLPINKQRLLKNYTYCPPKTSNALTIEDRILNTNMGRSLEDLKDIANIMYKGIKKNNPNTDINEQMCLEYVYIRVLDETWLGYLREINTKATLSKLFDNIEVRDLSAYEDSHYAVDCELYIDNKLICGIQIKSEKFYDIRYIKRKDRITTNTNNLNRNNKYTDLKNVPVYYVYSSIEGAIVNIENITNAVSKLIKS